ncbi:MAG: TlpA family protein disulfide reductase [Alphaproteobacteria bacterium]|nr:TlpA family protein disulfide reductase [Alphaproteobacteria bacterium]
MNKILRICLFLLTVIFCVNNEAQAKLNMFPQPRYVPDLSFYGDSGKAYKLKNFGADLLIAVVWSRRCGPCLADLKQLNEFALATADQGIRVILISPDGEWRSVDEKRLFLKKFGAQNLVSYLDKKAGFMNGMGIMVTPTALLINKEGLEVGQVTGAVQWSNPKVIDYMVRLKNHL